jgi:glutathione S-transferase
VSLTIYGSPRSRTMRVLWMAEELGLSYEHVPYEFDDPRIKSLEYLLLNPAGAVPTIVDDGFSISESLAINLYLAKKYDRGTSRVYASSPKEEASIWQWTLWVQGHLEPWVQKDQLLQALIRAIGDHAGAMIRRSLGTLSLALESSHRLVGSRFTVADLNVAAVLSPSRSKSIDLSNFPEVEAWLGRCYARPVAGRVRARYQGS